MKSTCKKCNSCPMYPETEEGHRADMYGCLPSVHDAITWYKETGKSWSCHSNNKRVCGGFLQALDSHKLEFIDKKPYITESTSLKEIYNEE